MSPIEKFRQRSREALSTGNIRIDSPPVDGGPRWGISAIMRPGTQLLPELSKLAAEAAAVAGPGHVVHGETSLHSTLRAFEKHSTRELSGDPLIAQYRVALDDACAGVAPIDLELRGVIPHGGGVMLMGHCEPDTLPRLSSRLAALLTARGICDVENGVRDLWYIGLLHFFAEVPEPDALLGWGDRQRDRFVGTVRYRDVELIRWCYSAGTMTAETLHVSPLSG
jgi:hypothetical protein